MCELGDAIILCACDVASDEADWILERRNLSLPERHRRGRAVPPRFPDQTRTQLEALAARLDEGGCFDFDYAPEDGDVLRVRLSGVWYRFRYAGTRERGAWSLDDSTGLTGWRAQMVSSSHGKLTTGD